MLSIGKLGKGQERYYLDKIAQGAEDYYSGEGEVPGRWMGDAAHDLGLSGEVGDDQLTAMLTGRNPSDGEPLGMREVPGRGPVPGFDLTFSAPKSVSLTWALGGPEAGQAVMDAHHRSVQAALAYMQRQACWTRRGAGGAEFVHGSGFLAAAFDHRSSRAGDPQLHTHVLIANATQGPDGRWTRLYHPAIYDHAKTAGYIYEANLRHELTQCLGVDWQQVRNGIAEIEGFADEHLREFSTRRAQILEAAGPDASARARRVATLVTREAKEQEITGADLLQRWRGQAERVGLDRETIERTYDPEAFRRMDAPAAARPVSSEQVDRAVTAGASHFDRRGAVQAVAELLREGASAAEVERMADAYLASDSVIRIGEGLKGPRYTTQRIWEMEKGALAAAERMRAEGPKPAGELVAARTIHARPTLKDDQRRMVERLLTNPEGVAVVIGEAGTGKTYAIVTAADGWEQANIAMRAAAPTWRAANVMRAEGLPASSVTSLLAELDRAAREGDGGLEPGSVLLVDEAGMVDSATLARLICHAEQANAKLVLVGDPEQLGEIEAGGLFRALAERSDPIFLDEVIRHRHEADREAAKRIREGEGTDALDLYHSEERVVVAPDPAARREAMVAEWHEAFDAGEDAVMIAKRNVEVERLNAMARAVRQEAGMLGTQEIEVGDARFAAGDQVIIRVNDQSAAIYNRERWQVAEVDPEQRRVVLHGVDQPRTVEVDADYLDRTNPHSDAPALQHAYAVTTYSAQGTTVDRAFVMADPSMDKQEFYVAASRSREQTYLYATPEIQVEREGYAPQSPYLREGLPHIAEAIERDRAQSAAHDEALRLELRAFPTEELVTRREALRPVASRQATAEDRHAEQSKKIAWVESRYESAVANLERVEEMPRRRRRHEMPNALEREETNRRHLEIELAKGRQMEPPPASTSRQYETVERVLAERREQVVTAARIAPPDYITGELGERPIDPEKRRAWDRGVEGIERYRLEHGITDKDNALGREPERGAERSSWETQHSRLAEQQQGLQREQTRVASRDMEHDLGHGIEMGIG